VSPFRLSVGGIDLDTVSNCKIRPQTARERAIAQALRCEAIAVVLLRTRNPLKWRRARRYALRAREYRRMHLIGTKAYAAKAARRKDRR
jgi:hypothetical protein